PKLEVYEVHRDEDESEHVFPRRPDARTRARIDGHQALELVRAEPGEPHDLDEVLGEVPEGASCHLCDLAVARRPVQNDGEVVLRDAATAHPDHVAELPAGDRGRVRDPRWQMLGERRSQSPSPERGAVEQALAHRYALPLSVCVFEPLMKSSTPSRAASSG